MSDISLLIDGKPVQAGKGQTLLQAAASAGIFIPALCSHPAVEAYGACRLCIVEAKVHGRTRLVTSCNYEAAEGLEVRTGTERVRKNRAMTLELLLARCPEVKIIRDLAAQYGVAAGRFPMGKDDCILCGLCVRICRERMGVGAADFVGRGAGMRVDTPYERRSSVCITCGACVFACPTGSKRLDGVFPKALAPRLSEFDMGLRSRPSIHIPFPQALPNQPVIDRANCVHFLTGGCNACRDACPAGAIDYSQEDVSVRIETGAVILAPGSRAYDASGKPELSFGSAPNVVSSLQFERILSASGPYAGNIARPSDRRAPKSIAFVQCVGSRDADHPWCSSVCCMYTLKEAIIAKEHEHDVECTLFAMDIRAYGKGFDAYYRRAEELGVRIIKCRPSRVDETGASRNLRVGWVTEEGKYRVEEFGLVVLASGLNPPGSACELARIFGITLGADGFAASPPFNPASSRREGVFLCGPFAGPKDIPESVTEASAAAAQAMVYLAESRGTLVKSPELPPERSVAGEPPRIGVFVCHCGRNIGGYLDVAEVTAYARTLPNVVFAMENIYTCSSDAQVTIRNKIAEHSLNRVVVASCSPRTHEPLFQQTIREAGLNVHLFEMANIRDQCSWVHMGQRKEATLKARDLVRLAAAKSRLTEPLRSVPLPVTPSALVVGGGIAGMTAALTVADQGYEVTLVEKESKLGGIAVRVEAGLDSRGLRSHAGTLAARILRHPRIKALVSARLAGVKGFVGNFETVVEIKGGKSPVTVRHGAAILAVGARESAPSEYLHGRHPRIVTLLELEAMLSRRGEKRFRNTVMIQCVGSREGAAGYCSRLCCSAAIKHAIRIKEADPRAGVFVLYRDVRTYGLREKYYEKARSLGVAFIRYEPERKPEVRRSRDGELRVTAFDPVLGAELSIPADLVVLSSRIEANPDNAALSQFFKVPLTADGFFLEAHAKLRPVDFATDGVFVCGSAHYPKDAEESISQAEAAAGRAVTVLSKRFIQSEGKTAFVRQARCSACGACVQVCPFKAVEIDEKKNTAVINDAVCKGCGTCAAACRCSAIDLRGFRDSQIVSMLRVFS
jgi:heterodisulfide reductase subunit A